MKHPKGSTPTEVLARFVCSLKYEDIPPHVVEKITLSVMDAIACECFGTSTPPGEKIDDFVRSLGGNEESTLWFSEFMGPAANVALALGTCIHAFDFDDYHKAKIHPAAVVVPACFTIGELLGVSGKQLVVAATAGYETMIRVALSMDPSIARLRGWHLTGTCGVFGAAAAAGKLLGLEKEEMIWAFGLAGTQASGVWAFNYDGAMSKRFHPGRAAQSGIIAACLAKRGFTGPARILDAEDGGLWMAMSGQPDPAQISRGLGETFHSQAVCIKPYASCGSNHAAIDSVRQMCFEHHLTDQDIERITVHVSRVIKVQTGFDALPRTVLQAQMSLKYAVAAAAMYGTVLPQHMQEDCFTSERAQVLMERTSVEVDSEMDKLYPTHFCSKVSITTRNGKQFVHTVIDPTGTESSPLDWNSVVAKSRGLMVPTVGDRRFNDLVSALSGLEELRNIRRATQLLRHREPKP